MAGRRFEPGGGGIRVQFTPVSSGTFRQLNPMAILQAKTIITRDFIPEFLKELKTYPDYPPLGRDRFRRYIRTEKLKRAWKARPVDTGTRFYVDARNDVSDRGTRYAGPVMGTDQWDLFRGIGWSRAVDIRDRVLAKMRIAARIQTALTFVGTSK